jgi:predicted branched-subunit amino acid permease
MSTDELTRATPHVESTSRRCDVELTSNRCEQRAGPSAARQGVQAVLPLLAAYVPFALVVGTVAAANGPALAGWAGSWLIFGGSAQLATMRTFGTAGPVAAILTGLLVNARLLAYSASLARRWGRQPRWFRVVAAAMVIDPTWAVAEHHAQQTADERDQRRHFLAAGLTLGSGWSLAVGAGALLGTRLDWLDLRIAVPLCLLALVGPQLRATADRPVIVTAAVVALVTAGWPSGTGLLAAIGAGCAAGLAARSRHDATRRNVPHRNPPGAAPPGPITVGRAGARAAGLLRSFHSLRGRALQGPVGAGDAP